MRTALIIARRELGSYFLSLRGYVLLSVALGLWGFYFYTVVGRYNFIISRAGGLQISNTTQPPSLHDFVILPYFELLLVSFALLIPLFAMRSFPEERQLGTLELLRTSPLRLGSIVGGKFVAVFSLSTLFLLAAALYPLTLTFFGTPDVGTIVVGLLGCWLAVGAMTAISLAIAVRARQPLMAALGGVVALSLLLLLHTPALILAPSYRAPLEVLSVYQQVVPFLSGFITLEGTVFFVAFTALGILNTAYGLKRDNSSGNSSTVLNLQAFPSGLITMTLAGGGFLLLILGAASTHWLALVQLVIAGGFILSWLVSSWRYRGDTLAHFQQILRLGIVSLLLAIAHRAQVSVDLSSVRNPPLRPFAREVLNRTTTPILIRYVSTGNSSRDYRAIASLRRYQTIAPERIFLEVIQPADHPDMQREFGLEPTDRVQLVQMASADRTARRIQLAHFSEDALLGAMQDLQRDSQGAARPKLYLLESVAGPRASNPERGGLSRAVTALTNDSIDVQVLPDDTKDLPTNAALVALIGPRTALPIHTEDWLRGYLQGGGKLLAALEPTAISPYLNFLGEFGVQSAERIVVDRDQLTYSAGRAGLQPLVRIRSAHPVVNQLGGTQAALMNGVAPVAPSLSSSAEMFASGLLFVSPGSVLADDPIGVLTGSRSLSLFASEPGSTMPVPVAVAVERKNSTPALVVFGDSDWMLNEALSFYSNEALLRNSVQWLLENKWALVERTTTEVSSTIALSQQDLATALAGTVLFAQALVFLGFLVTKRRSARLS